MYHAESIPVSLTTNCMPRRAPPRSTVARKAQHVDAVLRKNVTFVTKSTGLEEWEFVHNALPELDFGDIDSSTTFLGKRLHAPLLISSMTGGYAGARRINKHLAEACQETRIGMGIGSQRQALEDTTYHRTFSIVREVAPDIPIIGNIGAAEVAHMEAADGVLRLVDLVKADAFAVHLNPLQELLQPEGTPRFRGVLRGIALLVRELPVPVIVKEIGAGISADVARRLLDVGVRHIDVAGAGGTSWAGVEILRRGRSADTLPFWDWGIPTASAVRDVAALRKPDLPFTLIASGGIQSGLDCARSIALGADMTGAARPFLQALHTGRTTGLRRLINEWVWQLKAAMFLAGTPTLADLQQAPLFRRVRP